VGDPPAGRQASAPDPETSAHVTTVPDAARPFLDPEAIATSTELFYEGVAADSEAALALVSDAFRLAGGGLLAQEFADVRMIEVREISVDPVRGITLSTLEITRKDGSRTLERRELVFTSADGVPLIDGERPAKDV
ncbi:MAG: hypothetical protein HOV94_39055, partial [Saccharothrix sp.]|nr:hypothetical protein [Saccharothrix sp.]